MTFRVLVADSTDIAGVNILKSFAEVDVRTKLSEAELVEIIGEYDAMVVRSATKVTEKIIDAGKKLRIIGRAGVGVDNVDVRAASARGIFVVNSPQGNTVAAAEHTLALMFALARKVAAADASIREGKWVREKFMGVQLHHKILGIVGLGQVGGHVAKVAREMGMSLVVYDPYINTSKAESLGCRVVPLDELLSTSDFVTLHIPLVPETKNLINDVRLRLMKPTARIINCSRGGVVDEIALCAALTEGRLAGAALDVFEVEGVVPADSPLLNTPNLVLTPHLGASTSEAQINVAIDVAQQIRQTLQQSSLPDSAVNIPGLRASELITLRPLLDCCETLGKLAMQLLKAPVESIRVTAEGEFGDVERGEALLMSAANGVLSVHSAVRVNFVNVKAIADEQRIKLLFTRDALRAKATIVVELLGGSRKARISGTVTEDNEVLLKSFNDIPVFMILPGSQSSIIDSKTPRNEDIAANENIAINENMVDDRVITHLLYSRHADIPGVLARITATLGDECVNIANCHLGRSRDTAVAVFHVDGAVSAKTAENVQAIDSVAECLLLTL